jgi:septin family protein
MRDRYIQDTRIHCCLYFINPTGHSLRPIDVIVMKKLSEVVNVVPVIAKADSLTLEERDSFKQKVQCNVKMREGLVLTIGMTIDPCRALPSQHPSLSIRY